MVHCLKDPTPGKGQVREEHIVLSLRQPIRQAQSTYSYLIIKTADHDRVEGEGIDSK
jgi:hypothetical protein